MVGTIKTYVLAYLCMAILILGTPNKLAYTAPQYGTTIDDRLIFNSSVVSKMKELDSTLSRIKAKKDTIVLQQEEMKNIAHKAKANVNKVYSVDILISPSDWGIDNTTVQRMQEYK